MNRSQGYDTVRVAEAFFTKLSLFYSWWSLSEQCPLIPGIKTWLPRNLMTLFYNDLLFF